ncbi:hypothetical protein B0H14DRAFT_3871145 [Mycena olivaceomarginata]|nr:hypothetical protein B0H14DRAFT_3871145 [Mycena olivaceomarginata]
MLDDLKADEEQLLLLEEEFRELTMKEADILLRLTDVRAAKQRVRRLVAETKNRHAPIFALPDELLVSVIQAAQQATDHSARVEVVVSHVSQRFRWAVVGASSLWSSIELHWGVESDEDRFAAYLARSRTCTLSVTMKYHAFYGKEECEYDEVPSQLAAVALHISRIRRLTLHYDGTGLNGQDALMHFHSLHAPCLEYLEISSHAFQSYHAPSLSVFNGGAPRLTSLRLNNVCLTVNVVDPRVSRNLWIFGNPWVSGLTHLDFGGIMAAENTTARLLASCPQLTDLTLDDFTFYAVDETIFIPILMPIPMPIPMPSLRSLRVLCLDDRSDSPTALVTGVLSNMHTPALEVLQFSGVHIDRAQITSFFNRSSPSKALKSLTFANSSVVNVCADGEENSPKHIRPQALQSFPALESLTIVNISSLHTLTLRYKDSDQFGIAAWPKLPSVPLDPADTVTSRLHDLRTSVARLREIRPIHLRLPRSRFFTGRDDWSRDDPDFEMFDVQPLLRSLGYIEDTEDRIRWDVDADGMIM